MNRRGARFLSSSSSYASCGTRAEKTIFVPSGDQAASPTSSLISVRHCASPPSIGITYSWRRAFSSPRFATKAIRSPSGDQRGCASFLPPVSRRGGAEPSVGASQIDWRYSFSSPSIDQTTYATSSWFGRRRGSLTPVSW